MASGMMDVMNDPNSDFLPDLTDKPKEVLDFEDQVSRTNAHFCSIRNDIIWWYLSPPER